MLGRGLLGVGIALALYALIAAPASMRRGEDGTWSVRRPELLDSARRALVAVAVAVAGASALLWYALFTRDFSIAYVAQNTSHAAQPWYTFSAFWSGMSGSLLLWCLILAGFAAVFAVKRDAAREPFVGWALPVLAGTELFFLAITIGPENPFAATDIVPLDGRGMNPLLHSPGMVIHPPLLYAGLVGLIVPFAIVVSALIGRTPGWIGVVRRWTLVPWLSLGAGLVLGGAWAYTELGWGGYWGWDPVENAALLPWLATTAFIHSAMVQERRGMLKVWNVFLVTAAAVLATFGTFLTRSGLLSSVHSFAESPIGKWFFVFLGIQTFVGIGLLVLRLPDLRSTGHLESIASKESAFLANNLLFCGAVMVVLWGTILPLATEAAFSSQLAVGPPFFNRVMAPVGAMLLLLATFGTVVGWRRSTLGVLVRRLRLPAAIAVVAGVVALAVTRRGDLAGVVVVAMLLAATSVVEIARAARVRAHRSEIGLLTAVVQTFSTNPRRYAGYVVHLGLAVMVVGFAGSLLRTQTEVLVSPGERFSFAGFTFDYERLDRFEVPDKDVSLAVLGLRRGGERVDTLRPQLNLHRNWDQPQSEIAIRSTPLADVYVILAGTSATDDQTVFQIHHNPLVLWVWLGAAIAVAGGALAIGIRAERDGTTRRRGLDQLELDHADGLVDDATYARERGALGSSRD